MKFRIERHDDRWAKPCKKAVCIAEYDDCEYKEWEIEIKSLDELLALKTKDNELIITNFVDGRIGIEIIDTWRE